MLDQQHAKTINERARMLYQRSNQMGQDRAVENGQHND